MSYFGELLERARPPADARRTAVPTLRPVLPARFEPDLPLEIEATVITPRPVAVPARQHSSAPAVADVGGVRPDRVARVESAPATRVRLAPADLPRRVRKPTETPISRAPADPGTVVIDAAVPWSPSESARSRPPAVPDAGRLVARPRPPAVLTPSSPATAQLDPEPSPIPDPPARPQSPTSAPEPAVDAGPLRPVDVQAALARTRDTRDAAPSVHVSIGRVEVRASAPAPTRPATPAWAPRLSLDDYLRERSR
jgi:hypothetical protein